ncbi:UNVERIFIED_CONTAM: hypothetical protein Scaly_0580000 [Sesamum calycinum]|uniref:DUF4218 domain-containing protein n=1 Tax=Sesamum calycinum TaxID=2727403 RepID=A0AAW2RSK5_9LAMI
MANRILPSDHTLPGVYYSIKKLVKDLGLSVEKIHACKNGCMLYWKDDVDLEYCKFSGDGRYFLAQRRDPHRKKSPYVVFRYLLLTPRQQRLYSSRATTEHMTWHATHRQQRVRCVIYPMLKRESILNGCILILQKSCVMFGCAFAHMVLRRTTVNDLPTYGMASGWSTAGVMGCPVCMDDTRVFHLQHGDQILDRVVNISFAVEILLLLPDEVMDIKEKTKDNINARRDLIIICNCPELELDEHRPNVMPKAVYTVGKRQKRRVCEWIRSLKFPDGYTSHLANCVDMTEIRMETNAIQVDVPLERFLRELKKKVKNKAYIETSIVEAYIVEEIGMFTSQYFEPDMQSKRSMPQKNNECTSSNDGFQVFIFNYPSRASGVMKKRWLDGPEGHIIETYILTNCEVVTP